MFCLLNKISHTGPLSLLPYVVISFRAMVDEVYQVPIGGLTAHSRELDQSVQRSACFSDLFDIHYVNRVHSRKHSSIMMIDCTINTVLDIINHYKPVGDWISAPSRNFVAMATRVGPTTFCMVPLNRPSPRTPW